MLKKIDKYFYCSAYKDCYTRSWTGDKDIICKQLKCPCFHSIYPTPEQFKEEYGEDYTEDRPVWLFIAYDGVGDWKTMSYKEAKIEIENIDEGRNWRYLVFCACTPFGKPDNEFDPYHWDD